jgi:hypothetical protein
VDTESNLIFGKNIGVKEKTYKNIGVRSTLFTIERGSMGEFFIVDKPYKNMLKP